MSNTSDQLNLSEHWHVDCRLIAELPEDRVIGTRFLINVFIGGVTFATVLFTAWLFYSNLSIRQNISDWEKRMADLAAEVTELQRLQSEYAREATRIDQAYDLLQSPLVVSRFALKLGRTRPELMVIDKIESSPTSIVIRGSLNESSERASRVLGNYVAQLRTDAELTPLFQDIVMTDFQRLTSDGKLNFEITFRLKPKP